MLLTIMLLTPLVACTHTGRDTGAGTSTTSAAASTPAAIGSATSSGAASDTASGTASSAPSSGSPSAGTATPAGPASTGSTAHPSSGPASSSPAAGGLPWCVESQLRASIDPRHIPGNGTAGKNGRQLHAVMVDFQNTSRSTCVLNGYPGAAILDQTGHQVRQATRALHGQLFGLPTGQNFAPPVTLGPQAYAAAGIEGVDERNPGTAQAGCDAPRYPRILITPPNTYIPVPFAVGWPQCYSFEVHAVRALPDAPPVGLAAFVGEWVGHTRELTVAADGTATVSVDDGCCTRVYTSKMVLTNAGGTISDGRATATLTQLQITPGELGHGPVPKVGDSKTITIRNGILTDPFFDVTFCDAIQGANAACGA
jgi:hypothetical protein